MAKQSISIGTAPNDGTGDTLRSAGEKINQNFDEVYAGQLEGLIAPNLTTAQRNALNNPSDGQIVYNLTTNKLQVLVNGNWIDLN